MYRTLSLLYAFVQEFDSSKLSHLQETQRHSQAQQVAQEVSAQKRGIYATRYFYLKNIVRLKFELFTHFATLTVF